MDGRKAEEEDSKGRREEGKGEFMNGKKGGRGERKKYEEEARVEGEGRVMEGGKEEK